MYNIYANAIPHDHKFQERYVITFLPNSFLFVNTKSCAKLNMFWNDHYKIKLIEAQRRYMAS